MSCEVNELLERKEVGHLHVHRVYSSHIYHYTLRVIHPPILCLRKPPPPLTSTLI